MDEGSYIKVDVDYSKSHIQTMSIEEATVRNL